MSDKPKSEATKTRATLAAARTVVVAWDGLKTPSRESGGMLAARLALADAISRLRDELAT